MGEKSRMAPLGLAASRLGKRRANTQGRMMEIAAYRSASDIDVVFEDGAVRRHADYSAFKKGEVRHPGDTAAGKAAERTGERGISNAGEAMEIAAYRNCMDIDVAFEDGSVRRHVQYAAFKSGAVSRPGGPRDPKRPSPVGERRMSHSGRMMEITAYRGTRDIDVVFEDGAVREHVAYGNFRRGAVRHPSDFGQARVGLCRRNNRGEMMEIAAYRSFSDIDVVFEDGTVREGVSYASFRKGSVLRPKKGGKRP